VVDRWVESAAGHHLSGSEEVELKRARSRRSTAGIREILAEKRGGETLLVVQRLLRNRKGVIGSVILLLLIGTCVFAEQIAPYDPIELHVVDQFVLPGSKYWLGADELGRDILSRVIFGARISLQAGLLAVSLAGVIAVPLGLMAAYFGGWVDAITMRIIDTLLSFPAIFLAIGIVSVIGPGRLNVVIAVAIIVMPTTARLVRGCCLATKEQEFVLASRAIGASKLRIMFRTIFPNMVGPLLVHLAVSAPSSILAEASLSYLGLGSQPPEPTWGNMLRTAQTFMYQAPTYSIPPGVAIIITVIAVNYFADGLQDAIDPRRHHAAAKVA
jgi:peptide/nickel transport system permease protein